MNTLFSTVLPAVVLAAALATPVQALTLVSASSNGNQAQAAITASALPTVSADIGFNGFGSVAFLFELDAADADGLAAFNAVVSNRIGAALPALQLALDRGSFAQVGTVSAAFAAVASISGDNQSQRIVFSPAEPFGVDIGDPFSAAGAQDWLIGFAGMAAGSRFTLTVSAVSEPASAALLLAGGACLLSVARKRSAAARPWRWTAPRRLHGRRRQRATSSAATEAF